MAQTMEHPWDTLKKLSIPISFFYISYRLLKNDQYEWVKDIVTPFYEEDDRLIGYTGVNAPDIAHKEELDRIKKAVIEIGDAFPSYNGQGFFDFLVEYLATVLEVDSVLVGELTGAEKDEVTAISMYHKDPLVTKGRGANNRALRKEQNQFIKK